MPHATICATCGKLRNPTTRCCQTKKQRVPQHLRTTILQNDNHTCQITPGCQNPATTIDHILPTKYGGSNDPTNLQAACTHCNSRKGAR